MKSLTSSCWLDIKSVIIWSVVNYLYNLLSLHLLTFAQPREVSLENNIRENFLMVLFGCIGNLIDKFYSNFCYICLTFPSIKNTENFSIFSWTISILFEKALNSGNSLIYTTARLNVSLNGLLLVFNCLSFSNDNLLLSLYNSNS